MSDSLITQHGISDFRPLPGLSRVFLAWGRVRLGKETISLASPSYYRIIFAFLSSLSLLC
jgi:hypothetical protein